jgi:alginate O-acetyltransferase complex protein AlgI
MLFNSFIFLFAFLPITDVVLWGLRDATTRYVWLTLTGYVFYGYWDAPFCLLMSFSTLMICCAGLGFLRWSDPLKRKLASVLESGLPNESR